MTQHSRREEKGPGSDTTSNAHTSHLARGDDKPPSVCVVEAVSEVLETDPTDLGPLYEAIDPDALDTLLELPHQFQEGCITFLFEGCEVTVDADGRMTVSPEWMG